MREVEFDSMFSFIYSERPGTLAAMMPDRLSLEEKSARLSELQALQRSIQERLHSALIGTTALVLIEGPSRKRVDEWSGRLASGKVVNFADLAAARGEIVPVRIVAATSASFRGERVVPAPSHSGAA
jgi:tRNA-2-methylthio-N6-dimethylallyladenosine synthase